MDCEYVSYLNLGRAQIDSQRQNKLITCGFHTIVAQHGLVRICDNKGSLTQTLLKGLPQQSQPRDNYMDFASNQQGNNGLSLFSPCIVFPLLAP